MDRVDGGISGDCLDSACFCYQRAQSHKANILAKCYEKHAMAAMIRGMLISPESSDIVLLTGPFSITSRVLRVFDG